jgi:ABC-type multidrug transport system fused ATPase/permease subunit
LVSSLFYATTFASFNISLIAILNFGAHDYLQGVITLGELTSFLMYSIYVGATVTGVSSAYGNIMKSMGSSERIFEIIDRVPEIPFEMNDKIKLQHPIGKIEFRNVQFAYPTRTEIDIFSDLSFTVEPGQVIAFVGTSGAGKSTIPALLTRLYDPVSGEIFIDNHNLKDLDVNYLRENVIGTVSQEPVLFSGTIKENIMYGLNREATMEEIESISKKANAHEFIGKFPLKYETEVGERGQSLSGGQKQRISIARFDSKF